MDGIDPRVEIDTIVRETVALELKLDPSTIGADADLRELPGVESIKVLRVVAKLERRFQIELDDRVVFEIQTLRGLVKVVEDGIQARESAG